MENADRGIPAAIKVLHIRDREGDNYTIMNYSTRRYKAGGIFHTDSSQPNDHRMTVEKEQIPDNIRKTHCKGLIKTIIPRDR
jgi:hypothetical protein